MLLICMWYGFIILCSGSPHMPIILRNMHNISNVIPNTVESIHYITARTPFVQKEIQFLNVNVRQKQI